MRRCWLFLRSRQTGKSAALLVAVAAATWLWHDLMAGNAVLVALLRTIPSLGAAVAAAVALQSPLGEAERTASYPLPALRLLQLAGLLVLAALALTLATWGIPGPDWTLARNVAGFSGLALLAAAAAGSVGAWTLPFAYGALVVLAGASAAWAWPLRPIQDRPALLIAAVLLLIGLVTSARHGLREELGNA